MAGGESRLGMRVMYMISLNHGLAQKSITILHAYKLAENPRKPAQSRAFAHKDPRKFGLKRRIERLGYHITLQAIAGNRHHRQEADNRAHHLAAAALRVQVR